MKKQTERLLEALKKRPMTTGAIRRELGIGMPATRVFELRQANYDIRTEKVRVTTRNGTARVARYTLVKASRKARGRAA